MVLESDLGPFRGPIKTKSKLPISEQAQMCTKGYADQLISAGVEKKYVIPQSYVDEGRFFYVLPEPFEPGTLEVFVEEFVVEFTEKGTYGFELASAPGVGDVVELLYVPWWGVGNLGLPRRHQRLIDPDTFTDLGNPVSLTDRDVMYGMLIDFTLGGMTVSLPTGTLALDGADIWLFVAGIGPLTIAPQGATIHDQVNFVLQSSGEGVHLVYVHERLNWYIVGRKDF